MKPTRVCSRKIKPKIFVNSLCLIACVMFITGGLKSDTVRTQLMQTVYVNATQTSHQADGTPQNPFQTISQAIQAAAADADIYLASGTYQELVDLTKPLHLHGTPGGQTHLVAAPGSAYAVRLQAGGSLEGLHILSEVQSIQEQPVGIAISQSTARTEVRYCTIENFQVGVEVNGGTGPVTIENNSIRQNSWGVSSLHNAAKVVYRNNQITNNRYGLYSSDTDIEVLNNNIANNEYGIHIATRIEDGRISTAVLQENQIKNNNLRGLWFDQGTLSLNSVLDMGGGTSLGRNIIGNNGHDDLVNDSHGVINAKNNQWISRQLSNRFSDSKVIAE